MADDTNERYINPYIEWMLDLRNLYRLLERPKALQDRVFQKLFDQAEIARYSETERRQYEDSKKVFWDNYSVIKTARDKGVLEGIQKGIQQGIQQGVQKGILQEKAETVQRMKAKGFSAEAISEIAGLTVEEVEELLQ
jgi:predicted transposase/invertase (TIGR01784 family)